MSGASMLDAYLRARAEQLGAPKAHSDLVAVLARRHLEERPDGTVKVLDSSGAVRIGAGPNFEDMTADELLDELAATKPALFGPIVQPAPENEPAEPETPRARAVRQVAERQDQRQAAVAKAVDAIPNPYRPESRNLTVAVWMEAHDPQRAADLRREAAAPIVPPVSDPRPQ